MSVFALLRRIEALTAPAPSLAHDYDVPVQDVEQEVWEGSGDCFDCCVGHPEPEPAATTPAADAEAVESCPPGSPASALSFVAFSVPAICDVLAEHEHHIILDHCECGEQMDEHDWREHAAELIAERLETCLLNRFPK